MKRASIYLRTATIPQAAPTAVEMQRVACETLVEVLDAELVSVHIDAPGSGATADRSGLMALLAEVDAGELDVVVANDVTRLTRNATDLATICGRLRDADVELRTVDNFAVDSAAIALEPLKGAA